MKITLNNKNNGGFGLFEVLAVATLGLMFVAGVDIVTEEALDYLYWGLVNGTIAP